MECPLISRNGDVARGDAHRLTDQDENVRGHLLSMFLGVLDYD